MLVKFIFTEVSWVNTWPLRITEQLFRLKAVTDHPIHASIPLKNKVIECDCRQFDEPEPHNHAYVVRVQYRPNTLVKILPYIPAFRSVKIIPSCMTSNMPSCKVKDKSACFNYKLYCYSFFVYIFLLFTQQSHVTKIQLVSFSF